MEVAVRQQSLCLLLEGGVSRKRRALRIIVEFQNTVRQFYEWMDKLGKCVCCAYQKRRNVTKVGRPTEKRTFRCPRGKRIFLHKSFALRAEQRLETALRCFPRSLSPRAVRNIANDLLKTLLDSLLTACIEI